MRIKGCFSHVTDDWRTPSDLYKKFMDVGCVDCFPFHANYDEFEKVYVNKQLFVNPPYSKMKYLPDWIEKQIDNNCIVYLLIPARTDTDYFHKLLGLDPSIEFIKGRLHFNDSKSGAPFPSILLTFRPGGFGYVWCY